MIRLNDFIKLPIDREDIHEALSEALNNDGVGIDNLRNRARLVMMDCKIRGYIGEIALRKWFTKYNIKFDSVDFYDDETNMDIDITYKTDNNTYDLEVKTSLVPDSYKNMTGVIQRADIKIIKRTQNIEDVSGDIHIQIYFDFLRRERDNELKSLNQGINSEEELFNEMKLTEYMDNTYFVAWIDKPSLINFINNQSPKTWTFPYAQKDFWRCPLSSIAKKPMDIIDYINNLN